jgi:hypothetical protein
LGEFRFICFVETGLQIPFVQENHNQICFLVSPPGKNTVRLMTYRTFAWPIHESNKVLKSKGEALRIISGEVDFASYTEKFTIDKIIKASLLHRNQDNKGIIMKLVI